MKELKGSIELEDSTIPVGAIRIPELLETVVTGTDEITSDVATLVSIVALVAGGA